MLDWIEHTAGQTIPDSRLYTDPGVYEDDHAQRAALERRGFRPARGDGLLMLRSLAEYVAGPSLPEGFAARAVAGEHEAAARAAAHRSVFGSGRVTEEAYRRLMRTPGYNRDLDIVAVAPNGAVAAFALGWLDGSNRVGEFEPVGTRPAYRQLGLGRAVLLEGMRRMQALGAAEAVVGPVDAEDEAILRLYGSAGFRPLYRLTTYQKEL